jgi:hypothetical protein
MPITCKHGRIGVASVGGAESFLSSNRAQIKATREYRVFPDPSPAQIALWPPENLNRSDP